MSSAESFTDIFNKKYSEFCEELRGTCPELESKILTAKRLSKEERFSKFKESVLPMASPTRDASVCPGVVLPGVEITEAIWSELSESTKNAIQKYLTVLTFSCLYSIRKEGSEPDIDDLAEKIMKEWKDKLGSLDFENLTKNLFEKFTQAGAAAGGMPGMSGIPGMPDLSGFKLPEKFLKGHIAKLAEEIVSEFKPEDFGIDAATLERIEKEPSGAMQLLMNIYTNNPGLIQTAMKRIIKRLQEKFQKGQLSPEQIAAEAEELMKEFSGNTSFVELMEQFRNAFGMNDMKVASKVNKEHSARTNIVKERLRKRLEKKKADDANSKK